MEKSHYTYRTDFYERDDVRNPVVRRGPNTALEASVSTSSAPGCRSKRSAN